MWASAGRWLRRDALHVQKETARYVVEDKHADYLFTAVKDNQSGLFAALDALDWENIAVTRCETASRPGRDPHHSGAARPGRLVPLRRSGVRHRAHHPRAGQRRSSVAAREIISRTLERGGTLEALAVAARSHWDVEARAMPTT